MSEPAGEVVLYQREDGELERHSTVKDFLTGRREGGRDVRSGAMGAQTFTSAGSISHKQATHEIDGGAV